MSKQKYSFEIDQCKIAAAIYFRFEFGLGLMVRLSLAQTALAQQALAWH